VYVGVGWHVHVFVLYLCKFYWIEIDADIFRSGDPVEKTVQDTPLLVEDATKDDRFSSNPLVTGGTVGFYYGLPISVQIGDRCVYFGALYVCVTFLLNVYE